MKLICLAMGPRVSRMRAVLALALLAGMGSAVLCLGTRVTFKTESDKLTALPQFFGRDGQRSQQLRRVSAHMPLIFEANQGQSAAQVKFLSRGLGYALFLTPHEAVLEMQHPPIPAQHSAKQGSVVHMRLVGAQPAPDISGAEPLPGKSNYFIGNDPAKWRRNVPQFARVRYHNVYSGIDLVYYGKQGQLEYDFEVAPGADPRQVILSFDGPDAVKLDAAGDLLLQISTGSVRLQAPRTFQKRAHAEQSVPARFVLRAKNQVGFEIAAYDRSRELIIDPVLNYSTYLGGSGNEGCSFIPSPGPAAPTSGCPAIAADPGGTAFYVAGSTTSTTDFPTKAPLQNMIASGGSANVFVTKFNAAGNALIFSTYLGGSGTDYPVGIAVDSAFNVYVAGNTTSNNFPVGAITPFQKTPKTAGAHVFVSQLNPSGSMILYSTYLSGSNADVATGMAIDNRGSVFVTGTTASSDFPVSTTIPHYQSTFPSGNSGQFFASKVSTLASNSGASGLLYSTYFGGSNPPTGALRGGGIAVDTNGNFYITGTTNYLHVGNPVTDFPIVQGFQSCLDTPPPTTPAPCDGTLTRTDAFVAKFNPNVSGSGSLVYSTYLGGSNDDQGLAIAVDSGLQAYVTGSTNSADFTLPANTNPYQHCLDSPGTPSGTTCPPPSASPATDAFVAKIGGAASSSTNPTFPLNYFSYLGGGGTDVGLAIAVDSIQHVRVTGYTNSSDFPPTTHPAPTNPPPPSPIQGSLGTGATFNAFVAHIDTTSTTGVGEWGTYLGGGSSDHGTGIALDVNGTIYVTGDTNSSNFPVSNPLPPNGSARNGLSDIFVSKIAGVSTLSFPATSTAPNPSVTPNPVGNGNLVTFKYSIQNNGPDPATNILLTDVLPPASNATFIPGGATASPGSCIATPVNPTTSTGGVETCVIGTIAAGASATVSIGLTPTTTGLLTDTVSLIANGAPAGTASGNATVTDFQLSASPTTATVTAGQPASYTVTATPLPTYSGQVSLSCSSGLPSQATCAFSTTPVTFTNSGAVSSTLTINTVARPVTTAKGHTGAPAPYAVWLPISGVALLGLGIGSRERRRRRLLAGFLFAAVLGLILLQPACGSSKSTAPTPTGTPAGTYAVTVTGSSGSASHTTTVTLVVQ